MRPLAKSLGYAAFIAAAVVGARSSSAGTLLVTEAMPDPAGTDVDREWFEIYNAGPTAVDLSGYAAGDGLLSTNLSTGEGMGVFPTGTMIQPGQFMIIAARGLGFNSFVATNFPHAKADYEFANPSSSTIPDDPNAINLPQKAAWGNAAGTLAIANGADDVGILDPADAVVDMVSYNTTGTGVMVLWTDVASASIQRRPADADTDTGADWQYVTGLANSTPGFGRRIFWDIDGTGTPGGGGATPSGAWDGTTANFNTDSGGAGTTTLAVTSTLDKVTFTAGAADGTGAFTVDVSGTQIATILDVARGDVTFNGGTLAVGAVTVANTVNATISSVMAGGVTGKVAKSGPGTLTLSGANTYAGGTLVDGGTLNAVGASALGAATGPLTVNNPTTGAGTAVVLNLSTTSPTTVGSLSGAIATPSSGTNTATIDNGGQLLTVNQTAAGTYAGTIAGAGGLTKGGTGTLTLSGANTYTGTTTVNDGTLVAANVNAFNSGALNVTGGTAQAQASLPTALTVTTVSTTGTGKLDMTDNDLVIKTSTLAAVQAQITAGFNGGTWDGAGINSSAAATHPNATTALGYGDNAELGLTTFSGVALTGPEILVKYTYYGDADLTGVVDLDDFGLFLTGYQNGSLPRTWIYGDFDYTGVIDLDDFGLFLYGYQNQGGALSALSEAVAEASGVSSSDRAAMQSAIAAVPEPASLGVLGLAGLGLLGRRARRRNA